MIYSRLSFPLYLSGALLFLSALAQADPKVDLDLTYAQSPGLWRTYHQIEGAQQNLPEINSILSSEYGTYEEGFGTVSVEVSELPLSPGTPLLDSFFIGAEADASAYGSVDNPVVPLLHADVVVAGLLRVGVSGGVNSLGLKTRIGVFGGLGYEKRVDAFSTDLIEHLPFENGRLSFFGMDQDVSRDFPLISGKNSAVDLPVEIQVREAFFHSTITDLSDITDQSGLENFAFRWKEKNELRYRFDAPLFSSVEAGAQVIFGQQPIPVEILPVTWDYSHQLDAWPELGTLFGMGGHLRGAWSENSWIEFMAGVYAGYLGAGAGLRLGAFHFNAGSWGIEGRSAYLSQGSRLWVGNLGFEF